MIVEKYLLLSHEEILVKLEKFVEYKDSVLYRVKADVYLGQVIIKPSYHSFELNMKDFRGNEKSCTIDTWDVVKVTKIIVDFFNITEY